MVAPSPVVALSLREALPLGVRGSFRCSRCRFGLVLPLFLALLGRCRRSVSSTMLYGLLSVLRCRALCYFCCSLSLRPNGRTPTGAVCRSWGPAHSLLARGGPRPLLRFGCSLRSHRPTARAASAHRCQATPAVFIGWRHRTTMAGCRYAPPAIFARWLPLCPTSLALGLRRLGVALKRHLTSTHPTTARRHARQTHPTANDVGGHAPWTAAGALPRAYPLRP